MIAVRYGDRTSLRIRYGEGSEDAVVPGKSGIESVWLVKHNGGSTTFLDGKELGP